MRRLPTPLDALRERLRTIAAAVGETRERVIDSRAGLSAEIAELRAASEARAERAEVLLLALSDAAGAQRERLWVARAQPGYGTAFTEPEPLISVVIPTYENHRLLGERSLPVGARPANAATRPRGRRRRGAGGGPGGGRELRRCAPALPQPPLSGADPRGPGGPLAGGRGTALQRGGPPRPGVVDRAARRRRRVPPRPPRAAARGRAEAAARARLRAGGDPPARREQRGARPVSARGGSRRRSRWRSTTPRWDRSFPSS